MWWSPDWCPYRRESEYVPLWNRSRLRRQSVLRQPFCAAAPRRQHRAIRTARSAAQAQQQKRRMQCQQYRARG